MKLQVGVKALIQNDDGLYLFIRRRTELPDGSGIRWDIPGGRIKAEETLQAALKRELAEEANITLEGPAELLDAQDIFVPDLELHVVRLTYRIAATSEPALSSEHSEHQWLTLEQARELNVDDYLQKTLQKLAK